jgi:uncharacterized protein YlxW (UPF0749 family)
MNSYKHTLLYIRLMICIIAAGVFLYAYIEKQNELTELRLALPVLSKEIKRIQEENTRLKYEIEQFESPIHLMELARKPEFSHLKYGLANDVVILPEKQALQNAQEKK